MSSDPGEPGEPSVSVMVVARNNEAMGFHRNVGFRTIGYGELIAFVEEPRTWRQTGIEIHGLAFDS